MYMTRPLRASVPLILIGAALIAAACNSDGAHMKTARDIDWKSLEFVCTQEKNPPLDPEADAWYKTALAYEKKGDEKNDAEMVRLYEKAAATGHYKAILHLALLYSRGEGVARNESKAVDMIEQLMQRDVALGYYNMGAFLSQGLGVKRDLLAALAYFRKAADLGNAQGQYAVADELLTRFTVGPDHEKIVPVALQMLECAFAQGHVEAGYELGMHYLRVDKLKGLRYFQEAAKLGDVRSLYNLFAIFNEGDSGFAKDPVRAACYRKLYHEGDRHNPKPIPDIDRICPLPPKPMPSTTK